MFDLTTRTGRYQARKSGMDVPKKIPGPPTRRIDDFLRKAGECLEWTGGVDRCGYGRYHCGGVTHKAHRWVFEREHGQIPESLIVRHSCDNPRCCNIKHLLLGTHADNARDKVERNRQAKGERNGSAKLTASSVEKMRAVYAAGGVTRENIARQYGVSLDAAQKAMRGITWKHVP